MANLRVVRVKSSLSNVIKAQFTADLYHGINTSNVEIISNSDGISNPAVLDTYIVGPVLKITCQPLTPNVQYFVKFKSTPNSKFRSADGKYFLFEDGVTNVPMITGAEDPADPIRENLLEYLKDNVYSLDKGTIMRDLITGLGAQVSRSLYDVGQAKNDNYLEVFIQDEKKIRGKGPYDRLLEEGAFEVTRVGRTPTLANQSANFNYNSFPSRPISLLESKVINEELEIGVGPGTFDGLILTVKNNPVISLEKVVFHYDGGGTAEYPVHEYGYKIKSSYYDRYGSQMLTLNDNQFEINDTITDAGVDLPKAGDTVVVSYSYKDLGRSVDATSVTATKVVSVLREPVPPILNRFFIYGAPIVTDNDIIPELNGILFTDPLSNTPFSQPHPAFRTEIPFRLEALPAAPGVYSVDYDTGAVYVYGAETNDGTGAFPPLATYNYRKYYSPRLDYTYNPETGDLSASPLRSMRGDVAKISFNYERVLVPNVDYIGRVHEESLNERIDNRLLTLNSIEPLNTPVTNVFRIYNETIGEIYTINRFSDNRIYFSANTPPRIFGEERERASFADVLNETLILESEFLNTTSVRVFKIPLKNSWIIGSSEDCIGSSFNTSANFSRNDIFETELYFDALLIEEDNTDRLSIGNYMIDYVNGIIYVGVTALQNDDIGTINYKKGAVRTANKHIISVSDMFYSININTITERFAYTSFNDNEIIPSYLDVANERFINNDVLLPYVVSAGTITVSKDIKTIRGIYDTFDLDNNIEPTNFAYGATFDGNVITLSTEGTPKIVTVAIGPGNNDVEVPAISPGVEIFSVRSVRRVSDSAELYDTSGSFLGNMITLSGVNTPVAGEDVIVEYGVGLNGGATPIVDYNKGDYYVNYSYLADEILISYEYGDNVIDFRESFTIQEGQEYYVSYKVGALRDSLLRNFGTLIDLPVVNNFDISLARESYRDALQAALQSFTKGPTIPAMKLLVSQITKIDPQIIEAIFEVWSLGISHLFRNAIEYTGNVELLPGKYDNGILLANEGDTVTFPISSNLSLEGGTLEMWVIPEWDGLDNDAELTFYNLVRNGVLLDESQIFIGAAGYNPEYSATNTLILKRDMYPSPIGAPPLTADGLYIYYDDVNKVWNVIANDSGTIVYSGNINTTGEFYNANFKTGTKEIDDILRTRNSNITFLFNVDNDIDGITFMSDNKHYLFDFAKEDAANRFSLYKDGSGYLTFEIFDNSKRISGRKTASMLSTDISGWKAGEKHHVAIAWSIDTEERQDEMHLFVDGFEVPNIITYGGRPAVIETDRYRMVKPEIVAGTVPLNTVGGLMQTTMGSNIVIGDVDYSLLGITIGNTINIREVGFSSYLITGISGNTLTLNSTMPFTLEDARYAINEYSVVVESAIDLYKNIVVSVIRGGDEIELPGLRAANPSYAISQNMLNQNVLTLLNEAQAGDVIAIRTLGKNFRRCNDTVYVWGNSTNILKTQLPPPITLDDVRVIPILLPLLSIGPDNSTIVGPDFVATGILTSQPSNSFEGRTLAVRMTGGNVTFPATVTINGTSSGPTSETLTFSAPGIQNTINKWMTITDVEATVEPVDPTKNSVAIEIKEAFSITESNGNTNYALIRYSYQTSSGTDLSGTGTNVVTSLLSGFLDSEVGSKLVISAPLLVAGTYTITSRIDPYSVTVSPTPAGAFSSGDYAVFNTSLGRSGFQNGFFTFEMVGSVNAPFNLNQGYFQLDYKTYLEIPMDPVNDLIGYIGSDYHGKNQAKAIIDEFRILNKQLTDVRIGEDVDENQDYITTDFASIVPFEKNINTLMLLHFNSFLLLNDSDYYVSYNKEYLQSANSVNSRFGNCLVIRDNPLVFDNDGKFSTSSEGTIEFWVSPKYDTYNDPMTRFYFDASAANIEYVVSTDRTTITVSSRVSSIYAVRLANDSGNIGINYAAGATLLSDFKTIKLKIPLPFQQIPVKVDYVASGLKGDRISIYKDSLGGLNFLVTASGKDYNVSIPIFWERDSWHRIRATYKFNRLDNKDEIRLFVDGEEKGIIKFGQGLIFGTGLVFGQAAAGPGTAQLISDINFLDPINTFYVGSNYLLAQTAAARIDNLKLSNKVLPLYNIAGQFKDVNYNSNLNVVYPSIPDLYTTFLMDFDTLFRKIEDFSILRDEAFGIFNFTLNIIDSFGIVLTNAELKQILEEFIMALKPAQSKVKINYFV